MKTNVLAFIILVIFTTSCSQQQFAFRKTVRVKQTEQASVKKEKPALKSAESKVEPKEELVVADGENSVAQAPSNITTNPDKEAIVSIDETKPDINVTPEWKEAAKTDADKTAKPGETDKTMDSGSGFAIAGFVLSLLGLLVAAIPCGVLAIVFGTLGLKSDRSGLAIAALIIGAIDVALGIAYIASM